MKILAIDSSAGGCGVCVTDGTQILAQGYETMERGQDSRLIPMVQEMMGRAKLTYRDLDRVAVVKGPGSFTGLRIGLAAARGIGFAASKPVIGIDRFSIYRAQLAARKEAILIVLDSRRAELYTCFFPSYGTAQPARLMTPEEIGAFLPNHPDAIIVGDAATLLRGFADRARLEEMTEAEAVTCARLAAVADPNDPAFLPRPLYLRPPDVTIKNGDA